MGQPAANYEFPPLESERLHLRILTSAETTAVFQHFSDPEVTRYTDLDPLQKPEEALEIINYHIVDSGCRWGIFLKESGDMIGTCGLHGWRKEAPTQAEVGYDLAKAQWRKGIMTEVLNTVIPFGFKVLKLDQIVAEVEPENVASSKLLLSLGFTLEPDLRNGQQRYFLDNPSVSNLT